MIKCLLDSLWEFALECRKNFETTGVLNILYQDTHLIAIHKPAGLLVHRTSLDKYETEFALQRLRDQIGQIVYPIHRLDKPTSGVLLFALNSEIARLMNEQFKAHAVEKEYIAIVRGILKEDIDLNYALKEEKDRVSDKLARKDTPPQEARTLFSGISTCEIPVQIDKYPTARYSLIKALPKTGRKHQIRRHLRHLNHPIIGDVEHGAGKHNKYFFDTFQKRRMFLACTSLKFNHPHSNKEVLIQDSLDEHYAKVVNQLFRVSL